MSPAPQPQCEHWFRLFRFRSPLLTESSFLSFPPGTEMFHFPGLAPLAGDGGLLHRVAPFGYPRLYRLLTAYRGFSQLAASFIACHRLGILYAPLVA